MKSYDILQSLYQSIPDLTNRFNISVDIASVTSSASTTINVVTEQPHTLSDGDYVNIAGVYYPTPIQTVSRFGETATVVTSEPHDLTEGYQNSVDIYDSSFSDFNGSFEIISVPNRNTFLMLVEDSGSLDSQGGFIKELTGNKTFILNGVKQITLISETEFSYEIENEISIDALGVGSVSNGYRMGSAITDQAMMDMYTEQQDQEYWLFVVLGPTTASKDRQNSSDAIYVFNADSGYRQQTIHNFEIYIACPSSNSISAFQVRDEMEDMANYLIKSLCGRRIQNGNSSKDYYSIVFDSHATAFYDKSKYIHVFNFQSVGQISDSDIYVPSNDVAFRDIFLTASFTEKNIGE